MTVQRMAFSEMINQSIAVLTSPKIETFERFEKSGGTREALQYVVAATVVGAVVAFILGVSGGIGSAIFTLLIALLTSFVGFYVFAYVLYYIGKQQGGTGTQDEVFYTIALYSAPLLAITSVIRSIPALGIIAVILSIYQLYLAYIGSRSSMNIDQSKAIISVIAAIIAQWILFWIVVVVIGAIALVFGVAMGAMAGS
ncbi:MAG: DUF1282 domain-containing protein [Chloroflexi bacterium]|nr:DUF1282 domain-containing protein [Chloroflexota bacterium]